MTPYLAPCLVVLRSEVDARWPGRDRTSDGWIGDTAHQATRSDHNANSRGAVDALDIDDDGVHMPTILAAVEQHPSAHYWIYNRQIADADDGWRPRPYTGANPHDKHGHVSIRQTQIAEQDRRPWGLLKGHPMAALTETEQEELLKKVRALDARLAALVQLDPEITTTWSSVTPKGVERLPLVGLLTGARADLAALRTEVDQVDERTAERLAGQPVDAVAEVLQRAYAGRPDDLARLAQLLAGQAT